MKFKVTVDGQTRTYAVPPRVEIRFERDMKKAVPDMKSQEDVYRMAWMAAQDVDGADATGIFDVWIKAVDDISPAKDDERPLADDQPSGEQLPSPTNPAPA